MRVGAVRRLAGSCAEPRSDPRYPSWRSALARTGLRIQACAGRRSPCWIISRLDPQKDPLTLIRAAGFLTQRGTLPGRLAIVGNGSLREQAEAEIARLGLTDEVRLFPFRASRSTFMRSVVEGLCDLVLTADLAHRAVNPEAGQHDLELLLRAELPILRCSANSISFGRAAMLGSPPDGFVALPGLLAVGEP